MTSYVWRGNPRQASPQVRRMYRVVVPVEPPTPDLPGYSLKPDPAGATTVAEFIQALGELKRWAGNPSLRKIAARCGDQPTHVTFANMLHAERLPKFDLVLVYVEALGLGEDVEQWASAWRRIRMGEKFLAEPDAGRC